MDAFRERCCKLIEGVRIDDVLEDVSMKLVESTGLSDLFNRLGQSPNSIPEKLCKCESQNFETPTSVKIVERSLDLAPATW
jgi:hypothetical protein